MWLTDLLAFIGALCLAYGVLYGAAVVLIALGPGPGRHRRPDPWWSPVWYGRASR